MQENIIFLDIDGVLNGEEQFEIPPRFSKEAIFVLKQIITKYQAKIVITSSWQRSDGSNRNKIKSMFQSVDIEVFDFIHPSLKGTYLNKELSNRSCGILDYLLHHPCYYLILDDEYQKEYEFLKLHYYQTPTLKGLTKKDLPHLYFKALNDQQLIPFSYEEKNKCYKKRKI